MGGISGKLRGVEYFIWGLNEPDYVMKIMVTGGTLIPDGCKVVCCKLKDFLSHTQNNSYTQSHFSGISSTTTLLTITTTYTLLFPVLRTLGGLIVGLLECFHSCWHSLKSTCTW